MKRMKTVLVIGLFLTISLANSQETEKELFRIPLSQPEKPGKLIVEMLSGTIHVTAYTGKEVIVSSPAAEEKRTRMVSSDGTTGMKKIESGGLNISGEEKDNTVRIINRMFNKPTTLEIRVPVNFSLKLSTVNDGDIVVKGVSGELELSNVNGGITLNDIEGSASADTVNGDIRGNFGSVTAGSNMAFSSLNGTLDITFPNSLKANLKAKSDMGDVFTDFDMEMDKGFQEEIKKDKSGGVYRANLEDWIKGKINGGGPEILFKSFNGNILIRSK